MGQTDGRIAVSLNTPYGRGILTSDAVQPHNFRCSYFQRSAEVSVRLGETIDYLSIAYSPGNISVKNRRNPLMYGELIMC